MADSQVPWGVAALGGTVTRAAWREEPSWYLVADAIARAARGRAG